MIKQEEREAQEKRLDNICDYLTWFLSLSYDQQCELIELETREEELRIQDEERKNEYINNQRIQEDATRL